MGATRERRVPVQERSKKRLEAILEAAARLFADAGYEQTTMEGIAEAAGTSIGSVYQFFPNKLAVFEAVAETCLERSRDAFDALFAGLTSDENAAWEPLVDLAVDAFAALNREDPAFRATFVNFQLYGVYEERDVALARYFAERLADLLAARAPELAAERRAVVANTVVQTVSALLFVSERAVPSERDGILEEAKLMLRRYLGAYLPASRLYGKASARHHVADGRRGATRRDRS